MLILSDFFPAVLFHLKTKTRKINVDIYLFKYDLIIDITFKIVFLIPYLGVHYLPL